uniref:DUF3570 domain-containing protein n=1 Tax=candidate division WOR-3 bacterium TaxID=2052148 RepID=A0A7V3PT99_UNCW3
MSKWFKFLLPLLTISAISYAKISWLASFTSDLTYDQNIFYLSPSDLEKYRQRTEPLKFPYHSADDLTLMLDVELTARFSKLTILKTSFRIHNYASNQEKSYGLFRLRMEQQVGERSRIAGYYSWLPNYLIRYYRAGNSQQYSPCRFGEQIAGVNYRLQLGTFAIGPGYQIEFYNYIAPFEYYDTRAHRFNGNLNWQPKNNLKLQAEYYFKIAQAKGPLPDISYSEHNISLELATRPRRFTRFGINTGYQYSYRYYTTPNSPSADPYHASRVDQIQNISITADYLFNSFTVYFQYEFEWREVDSPYREQIEEIKNYRTNRVGAGVKLPLKMQARNFRHTGGG